MKEKSILEKVLEMNPLGLNSKSFRGEMLLLSDDEFDTLRKHIGITDIEMIMHSYNTIIIGNYVFKDSTSNEHWDYPSKYVYYPDACLPEESQLLWNHGLLTKINKVVIKRAKHFEIQYPLFMFVSETLPEYAFSNNSVEDILAGKYIVKYHNGNKNTIEVLGRKIIVDNYETE